MERSIVSVTAYGPEWRMRDLSARDVAATMLNTLRRFWAGVKPSDGRSILWPTKPLRQILENG
jgi:hypothetical protein